MFVQLRQNGPCARRHGAVPLPAAYLLAHTVSPQNNVKDIKKKLKKKVVYDTLHFKLQQYLLVFKDTGDMLRLRQGQWGEGRHPFFLISHTHTRARALCS